VLRGSNQTVKQHKLSGWVFSKEIALKTTLRVFIGVAATGLFLVAQVATAGANTSAVVGLTSLVVGQSGAKGGDPRREVLDRLSRARQAMDEGSWEIADSLIGQAEKVKVEFGRFHLGDTPAKARRDLERRRPGQAPGAGSSSKAADNTKASSKSLLPGGNDRQPPMSDPFQAAGRGEISTGARSVPPPPDLDARADGVNRGASLDRDTTLDRGTAGNRTGRLPATGPSVTAESAAMSLDRNATDRYATSRGDASRGGSDRYDASSSIFERDNRPQQTPFGHDVVTSPDATENVTLRTKAPEAAAATGDAKSRSDALLIMARRALAVGDVQRATLAVEQAKALPVKRDFHEDSPAKVEATVHKYADLNQRTANKDTEAYRRRYVELLMDQAEGLLASKDCDEAERLANDAKKMPVTFGPFDAKPDDLLKRIATVRKQAPGGLASTPGQDSKSRLNQDVTVGLSLPDVSSGGLDIPFRQDSLTPASAALDRQRVLELVGQARAALAAGDLRQADQLAREAKALRVPDSVFQRGDDRPDLVLLEIQKQATRGVVSAGGAMPDERDASGRPKPPAGSRAVYNTAADRTRNVAVAGQEPLPTPPPGEEGRTAEFPSTGQPPAVFPPAPGEPSLIDKTAAGQQVLARKVAAEVGRAESEARRLAESDPKRALEILQQARAGLEKAGLDEKTRGQFTRSVDRRIDEVQRYIESNRPRIELSERNAAVLDEIDRERATKVEVQNKLAKMVDDFNKLMDEERWAEAEVMAKRADELYPEEPVVQQILQQSKFVRRFNNNLNLEDAKERGVFDALRSVDEASKPFDDSQPYVFNRDVDSWNQLTKRRKELARDSRGRRSEKEIEIEQRLKTPVSLKFQDAPLAQVLDNLAKLAQVNLHLDPRGLAEEGVTSETPVTIDLNQDISLKSALHLILEPLHLSYVIKDEVLKITSEQLRDGEVYTHVYNVAELVIPIPMFTPNGRMGLAGALHDAQSSLRPGGVGTFGSDSPLAVVASNSGAAANGIIDPRVLAQMGGGGMGGGMGGSGGPGVGMPQSFGGGFGPPAGGPGGLGGGAQPDFQSLIQLITTTIQPTTWDENGGPGAIQPHFNNLSLVVSNTQQVHEQIEELLQQLRRLQDLQVTIEVRFITLNDNFFERIGIDFDFDINDNIPPGTAVPTGISNPRGSPGEDPKHRLGQDVTVGLQLPNVFSADLDIPFRQDSFLLSRPQFGGFDPAAGASLGFAILSDLEAFFFIEAAQGDRRSNVLQAPKVTLFNGQQAFVSDTSQSPFVISVIPVVGDFAAAQQPVIVVLSEGTFLTVQAVVSNDKRFVRLTVVPFFSNIGDVNTFTFTGSSTSTEDDSSEGKADDTTGRTTKKTTSTEGTTVQLPTFSFVTVTTTVSVPDGGTVLLGGIKRLSEGRNEFGVPILNKIPYINRLFSNVGIGRETQSLMMMVTPRIIIQEEEEFNLTGQQPAP